METNSISTLNLILGYSLLIVPLGLILWQKIPLFNSAVIAVARMTIQLLFVGFYLQVIFNLNKPFLNILWIIVMIVLADSTIIKNSGLRLKYFAFPVFMALILGTAAPLMFFITVILNLKDIFDARFIIPIGGMILGNCLQADIIGIKNFYNSIKKDEKSYQMSLGQGASLQEAVKPFFREACLNALTPTVASITTIGLVFLPGMMVGVILGGQDPLNAIKYQIAIMIAIFSGTAITVFSGIWLSLRISFNDYGILNKDIFRGKS